MSAPAIRAQGLSKLYCRGEAVRYRALRDTLNDLITLPFRAALSSRRSLAKQHTPYPRDGTLWALKDVSFDVSQGEVVGIIGRNGAGKSTLLKILARITVPSAGSAEVYGRIGSLLEVGTGFHPELTGRENVYLNGVLLGMSKREVAGSFESIVEFSELERFIDSPLKFYSAGMYMRLAFAVAAHLDTELLLVDEVLAVGDAAFQKKCLGKMTRVASEGRTVLFVSHDLGAVHSLTQRCLWLKDGQVHRDGSTDMVIREYVAEVTAVASVGPANVEKYRRNPNSSSLVRFVCVLVNGTNALPVTVTMGASITLSIELEALGSIRGAGITVFLKDSVGRRVAVVYSEDQGFLLDVVSGRHTLSVRINNLPFTPGAYLMDVGINQSPQTVAYDVLLDVPCIMVENNGQVLCWPDRPWGIIHWTDMQWRFGVS